MKQIYLKLFFSLLFALIMLLSKTVIAADHPPVYFKNIKGQLAKAYRLYQIQEYEKSERILQKYRRASGILPMDVFASKLLLARIYLEMKEYGSCIALYQSIAEDKKFPLPAKDVSDYIDLLRRTGAITEAIEIADRYSRLMSGDVRFNHQLHSLKTYYQYKGMRGNNDKLYADTVNVGMPGSYIYGFQLYKDGFLFLANKLDITNRKSLYVNSKLYQFTEEEGIKPFKGMRNILQHGPVSFYNNDSAIVFTDNQYKNTGFGYRPYQQRNNLQLYTSHIKKGGRWSKPVRITRSFIKQAHRYSFMHPSVIKTDSVMRVYFASDMPGGYGGADLYFADYQYKKKKWNSPVNLGRAINTNGDELYPEVRQDTLLFSSNGLLGYGGQDLFMASLTEAGKAPFHFPYPINTQFDDISMTNDNANGMLYFSSNRTTEPELISLEQVFKLKPDMPLTALGSSIPEHIDKQPVRPSDSSNEIFDLIVPPVSKRYKTICFPFNLYALNDGEAKHLDGLYQEWTNDKRDMICIEGHTDQTGTETYNVKLSELRAMAIRKYLLKKGVPDHQLRTSWYGSVRPVAAVKFDDGKLNKAEAERVNALNRRTDAFICKFNAND